MPKPPGKGLVEKRTRLVRLLDGHVRWLAMAGTLTAWDPPARVPYPPMPYGGSGRQRSLPEYVSPRERSGLQHRAARPEDLGAEAIAAWVAEHAFVREGLRPATQRALAYMSTFAPR